jgi:hypothetical protein
MCIPGSVPKGIELTKVFGKIRILALSMVKYFGFYHFCMLKGEKICRAAKLTI